MSKGGRHDNSMEVEESGIALMSVTSSGVTPARQMLNMMYVVFKAGC